jgi:hypothetical protein
MKINKIALFVLLTGLMTEVSAQINLNLITAPTKTETASALKEALNTGVKKAVDVLSKQNGFAGDKEVKIAFPEEIKKVDKTLRSVGLGKLSDDFVKQLNTGAEKAVVLATPILIDAIKSMTFDDAMKILMGGDGSATKYFETKTMTNLYSAFKPKVKEVLDQYGVSASYTTLMTKYNAVPFVSKANTDLTDYVTKQTLKGLFLKLTQEENKIRSDANLRPSPLLQKVFGYVNQKSPAK